MNKIRCVSTAGPGTTIDGPHGPVMIMRRCAKSVIVGYYCASHRQQLPTLEALVEHLNDDALAGEDHRNIAVYCSEHRTYESAPYLQIRALSRDVTFAGSGL